MKSLQSLLFIVLITFGIFVQAERAFADSPCREFSAREVGQKNIPMLDPKCQDWVSQNAGPFQRVRNLEFPNENLVFGAEKIVFFELNFVMDEEFSRSHWGQISGDQTLFQEVSAITLGEDANTILVLSRPEGALYTFKLNEGGNVAPLRIFHHPLLKMANFIYFSSDLNAIIVGQESEEVHYFNPTADERSRKASDHQTLID